MEIVLSRPARSITVSTVQYAIGATVPAGPIYVDLSGTCTSAECAPPFDGLAVDCGEARCSNAIVEALPDLQPTSLSPAPGGDDAHVRFTATIANRGDAESPAATSVVLSTPWETASAAMDPIPPGGTAEPSFTVAVPASARGSTEILSVAVDPENTVTQRQPGGHAGRFEVTIPPVNVVVVRVTTSTTITSTTTSPAGGGAVAIALPPPAAIPKPPVPPEPWWRRWAGVISVIAVLVLLLGAAGFTFANPLRDWWTKREQRRKREQREKRDSPPITVDWGRRHPDFGWLRPRTSITVDFDPSGREIAWQKGSIP
jgi:hypothetical protein